MHVLFLTQIVPYPPDAGPKVKTWHVLRYLAQRGHTVTLMTFYREEEKPFLENLKSVCARVIPIPMRRSRLMDAAYLLKSNFTGRPFIIERDDLPPFRRAVAEVLAQGKVDVIHADQLGMAQFALPPAGHSGPWPATLFDAHNAVWSIVERMKETAPLPLKPVLALETRRVRQHESQIVQAFDHTLTVSEPDAEALRAACLADFPSGAAPSALAAALKARMTAIPIAVDTRELTPIHRRRGSQNILTLGTLHYPPNADGIRWFANEVFPQVLQRQPQATLTIVGKNPPADFLQLAAKYPGVIRVTGYVPDLTPYMEEAALMAVPVRAGGGIRVRILEAFARAMPVVTTTVGLEGIHAQPGQEVIVQDDAAALAEAVVQLLGDEARQEQLAQNGRRLAERLYDWQIVLQTLDQVYAQLQQRHPAGANSHA